MADQTASRGRSPRPALLPLLTGAAVLVTVGLAALTLTGPLGHRAQTDAMGRLASADRLDEAQAERAQAQALADRFANGFARYLSRSTSTRDLRRVGATQRLVRRIAETPQRGRPPATGVRYRPAGVVVTRIAGGWLATTILTTSRPARAAGRESTGLPLAFRLEHDHPGTLLVVDVNAGGRE